MRRIFRAINVGKFYSLNKIERLESNSVCISLDQANYFYKKSRLLNLKELNELLHYSRENYINIDYWNDGNLEEYLDEYENS